MPAGLDSLIYICGWRSGVPAVSLVLFCSHPFLNLSGCYLVATSLGPGDIIIWRKYGGIIVQWFCSSYDGLYVRRKKLDFATRMRSSRDIFG